MFLAKQKFLFGNLFDWVLRVVKLSFVMPQSLIIAITRLSNFHKTSNFSSFFDGSSGIRNLCFLCQGLCRRVRNQCRQANWHWKCIREIFFLKKNEFRYQVGRFPSEKFSSSTKGYAKVQKRQIKQRDLIYWQVWWLHAIVQACDWVYDQLRGEN